MYHRRSAPPAFPCSSSAGNSSFLHRMTGVCNTSNVNFPTPNSSPSLQYAPEKLVLHPPYTIVALASAFARSRWPDTKPVMKMCQNIPDNGIQGAALFYVDQLHAGSINAVSPPHFQCNKPLVPGIRYRSALFSRLYILL